MQTFWPLRAGSMKQSHWLNEAIRNHADWLVFLNVDPRFDSLDSDPRFIEILRQINLKS